MAMDDQEKRRFERVPFSTTVQIRDQGTGLVTQGRSIDLSRGGIGFFAERFLPQGTRIRLTLTMRIQGRPVTTVVDAIVMRATTEGAGGVMGAQFDKVLNPLAQSLLCEVVDSR
jgi:hypothetical protein